MSSHLYNIVISYIELLLLYYMKLCIYCCNNLCYYTYVTSYILSHLDLVNMYADENLILLLLHYYY